MAQNKIGMCLLEETLMSRQLMSMHKFRVSQHVSFTASHVSAARGAYEIKALLPVGPDGEPQYRIKSHLERHDRMVQEGQIERLKV